ncbi:PAS domain-containing protein, partial [Actinomadura sp. 7K507]|uniref:PAS domain-containing protein n=1 Tax=Actinomadura sp. 7K507 TaxID=2530365 RepID=UPI0010D8E088
MVIDELLGVARMTAITLNGRGRVSHWDDTAEHLFGAGRLQALGRPLSSLLRLPPEHRGAFEPGIFGHVWCGACILPRADTGELTEVGWWVYPIEADPDGTAPADTDPGETGPGETAPGGASPGEAGPGEAAPGGAGPGGAGPGGHDVRVLALAADLRRLRDDGPGVTVGDLLIVPPEVGARRPSGARLLRVEPALTTPAAPGSTWFADRFTARLASLLPALEPAAAEWIASRVLGLGCPAVSLGLTVRIPIVPHSGAPAVPAPRSAPVSYT